MKGCYQGKSHTLMTSISVSSTSNILVSKMFTSFTYLYVLFFLSLENSFKNSKIKFFQFSQYLLSPLDVPGALQGPSEYAMVNKSSSASESV